MTSKYKENEDKWHSHESGNLILNVRSRITSLGSCPHEPLFFGLCGHKPGQFEFLRKEKKKTNKILFYKGMTGKYKENEVECHSHESGNLILNVRSRITSLGSCPHEPLFFGLCGHKPGQFEK